MYTNSSLRSAHEEHMRGATISKETRDYLVAYGMAEDLWDFICSLIDRDYDFESGESDRFGELMARVTDRLEHYIHESVSAKLLLDDTTEI